MPKMRKPMTLQPVSQTWSHSSRVPRHSSSSRNAVCEAANAITNTAPGECRHAIPGFKEASARQALVPPHKGHGYPVKETKPQTARFLAAMIDASQSAIGHPATRTSRHAFSLGVRAGTSLNGAIICQLSCQPVLTDESDRYRNEEADAAQ